MGSVQKYFLPPGAGYPSYVTGNNDTIKYYVIFETPPQCFFLAVPLHMEGCKYISAPPNLDPLNHGQRKKGLILHSTYIPDRQIIAPEEVLNKCGCKTECKSAMSTNVKLNVGLSCTEFCKCKSEGSCAIPFNAQHETNESDESCFESFDE